MLSGSNQEKNHVRLRLLAMKECLIWITESVDMGQNLEITIICSDVFIVNLIREWIRKWDKNGFNVDSDERPNKDLLQQIMVLIKNVKIDIRWSAMEANEMIPLTRNIENSIVTDLNSN